MKPNGALLAEFDYEMRGTRKALTRVADEHWNFRPHQKSKTLGELASHIGEIPGWVEPLLLQPALDLGPSTPRVNSADNLAAFDRHVAGARRALEAFAPEGWHADWTLTSRGHTIFTQPRAVTMRSFVMNHLIHHRAQLTVYLRLLDIPVPGLYGPSADER